MPDRVLTDWMLKDDAVNSLSPHAEVFYRRLYSVVDDHGRFEYDPTILASRCYPRRFRTTSDEDVACWVQECAAANLVSIYSVGNKSYILCRNMPKPRSRMSKFPPPPFDEKAAPLASKETREGGEVYVIKPARSDIVKIGTSTHVESRLDALRKANHDEILHLFSLPGGRQAEKELHRRFRQYRFKGEWFRLEGELLAWVKENTEKSHAR